LLKNYPDVSEVFNRDGADAMRWFLMSSPILRGGNLIVTEQGIRDGVRQVMIPLWNAWYFFSLYANVAQGGSGYQAKTDTSSADVLDRYILAKLAEFARSLTADFDALHIAGACDATRGFGGAVQLVIRFPGSLWMVTSMSRWPPSTRSTRC
jgi:isoleucyl-tRNA synthetase